MQYKPTISALVCPFLLITKYSFAFEILHHTPKTYGNNPVAHYNTEQAGFRPYDGMSDSNDIPTGDAVVPLKYVLNSQKRQFLTAQV